MSGVFLIVVVAAVFGTVAAFAFLIGRAPIASQEDLDSLAADRRMLDHLTALRDQTRELATAMALHRGRAEQANGLPVYRIDPAQNAPTSMTLQ